MNILFLNSASRGWGGNEKSILLVAEILSTTHQVVLAYRDEDIGKHTNITKYQLPFVFEGDLYTIARLVDIIKKHRIDIIIPSKRKDYALAGFVSRICSIKNLLWLGALRTLKDTLPNRLIYNTLADGIIVNATQIKEGLIKTGWIKSEKIRVIYNGIDTRELDRFVSISSNAPDNFMFVTTAGRLDANKAHDVLLHGFAQFLAMEPDAQTSLCIMGEGDKRAHLERLIKELRLGNHVSMPGFNSNPYPNLARSSVFVMTSESEGLSIALLEAMYLGNAPVSTHAGGGVSEIISNGKNGLLFDCGDKTALAAILRKLYLEPDYRRHITETAKKSVAEKYSVENVMLEMTAFCHETLMRDYQ